MAATNVNSTEITKAFVLEKHLDEATAIKAVQKTRLIRWLEKRLEWV